MQYIFLKETGLGEHLGTAEAVDYDRTMEVVLKNLSI